MMKIEIIRHLKEGEMIPKGYGVAYIEYNRDVAVLYPIPINVVVALGRRFWYWVKGGAYEGGYNRGYKEGMRVGRKEVTETVGSSTIIYTKVDGTPIKDRIVKILKRIKLEYGEVFRRLAKG